MTLISANRGEWSELYAIGYLITRGGGFAADEFTRVDESIFYKVLEIVDNPTGDSETIYKLHDTEVEIFQSGVAIVRINKDALKPGLSKFFDSLIHQSDSHAFTLAEGFEFMNLIRKEKLSASSTLTSDLHLVLEDLETKAKSERKGFSINSEIGSPATIFNASHSTNLTYKIVGKGTPKPFMNVNSVKKNLKQLLDAGFTLKFERFDNPTFEKSLQNIDSNLPEYKNT